MVAYGGLFLALTQLRWPDDNVDPSARKCPGGICPSFLALARRNLCGTTSLSIYGFHELFIDVQHISCFRVESHNNAYQKVIDIREGHDAAPIQSS
jgi:hypothetical protein